MKKWKTRYHAMFKQNLVKTRVFMFSKKKSKKVTFFHFSKLKIDVWLKMSIWSRKYEEFYFCFFKLLLRPFRSKWKKLQKKMKKMIPYNFNTKFGQNTTFHVLEKKVKKSHFFSFLETQNRYLTKYVSLAKKKRRIFYLLFQITFWGCFT